MSAELVQPPPVARRVPKKMVIHGDERQDDYSWLRDRANPGVIEYIEAENRYTKEYMKPTEQFQKKLFKEMLSEVKQTDETVPDKIDDYFYYARTEDGKQYPIYCRKKGALDANEEIILDVNKVAEGNVYFYVDLCRASPNHDLLMYLADSNGSEKRPHNQGPNDGRAPQREYIRHFKRRVGRQQDHLLRSHGRGQPTF